MNHSFSIRLVVLVLVFEAVCYSSGYRWKPVKSGGRLPIGALVLSPALETYVGRARHYDELLPAEVYNGTYALIHTCSQVIIKHNFDVLVDAEHCVWKPFTHVSELPKNVLQVGNQWNGEPNYLAYANDAQYSRIASILLTSNKLLKWEGAFKTPYALVCDDDNKWVDTASEKIPKNAVFGGKSENNYDAYVARLKKDCNIVSGRVLSDLGVATAVYEGNEVYSSYCQVLVGDRHNYSWVSAQGGQIPDYAVVAAKSKSNELMYVARRNKTLGYLVHSEALQNLMPYEILVKDEEE